MNSIRRWLSVPPKRRQRAPHSYTTHLKLDRKIQLSRNPWFLIPSTRNKIPMIAITSRPPTLYLRSSSYMPRRKMPRLKINKLLNILHLRIRYRMFMGKLVNRSNRVNFQLIMLMSLHRINTLIMLKPIIILIIIQLRIRFIHQHHQLHHRLIIIR